MAARLNLLKPFVWTLLLTLPVWAPLTRPGLPATQAAVGHVLQLYALERGEPSFTGRPPARWWGEGPLAYSIVQPARRLGLSAETAIKLSTGLAFAVLALALTAAARHGRAGADSGALAVLLLGCSPVFLATLYQVGDLAALWVLAAQAVGLWGLLRSDRPGMAATALAGFGAVTALPGMGLLALLTLVAALAGRRRRPVALLAGGLAGLVVVAPWARPPQPMTAVTAPLWRELLEPGWPVEVQSLARAVAPAWSLGLPLVGLVLGALWLRGAERLPAPGMAELRPAVVGGLCALVAVLAGWPGLRFLAVPAQPRHWLLLGLPLLALTAAMEVVPQVKRPALRAALIILPFLGAGPGLAPAFAVVNVPPTPVAFFGDDAVVLLRLQSEGRWTAGGRMTITADWLALAKPTFDYSLFIHVLDAEGNRVAQLDTQPQGGARPMTTWEPGEVLSDRYELTVPAEAKEPLRLMLGLYNWQTLVRLPVRPRLGAAADAITLEP
jgi:hypothetical protein